MLSFYLTISVACVLMGYQDCLVEDWHNWQIREKTKELLAFLLTILAWPLVLGFLLRNILK